MHKEILKDPSRRKFIMNTSGLLAGGMFLSTLASSTGLAAAQEMKDEFSPKELQQVKESALAQDLRNYFGKGYSCAEAILMVSLHHLQEPEELVWAAAGFGGGIKQKDLCGFLTGGVMALGIAAKKTGKDREESLDWCGSAVKDFWQWWQTKAPLHCEHIRVPGASASRCMNLGLRTSVKLEQILSVNQSVS